ncbi:HAMP domain-containing protein [bacterium]|nr:MAG: HAMP domain-containing protein [bacterium]
MSIQSVKTRLMGSYLALLILFVMQVPVIYFVVNAITVKFDQVDTAGMLRKRAIELVDILDRHIMTGDDQLEKKFQVQLNDYGKVLDELKKGSKDLSAITDAHSLQALSDVEKKWNEMKVDLNKGMHYGDEMMTEKTEVEESTALTIEMLNAYSVALAALNDTSLSADIKAVLLMRIKTVKISYLAERFFSSYAKKDQIINELNVVMLEYEQSFNGLRKNAARIRGKGAKGEKAYEIFKSLETKIQKRKEDVNHSIASSTSFNEVMIKLEHVHVPDVVSAANTLTKAILGNAENVAFKGISVLVGSVLISGVVVVFFMWSTNAQLIKPIMKIKEAVQEYAKGNLTTRANIKVRIWGRDIKDEITSLGDSVDEMAGQMSSVLGKISDSSNMLASASEQLSASSSQIEQGATRQSGQTGQIATAMEEMNATVIEVAKNAQQASESARGAREMASKGGDVVKQAITAMKEVAESTSVTAETIKNLGKSSANIGAIVSVINDIADQTNLLALNAAIEAARAGEQGRGFAVVADEVRKLAERTTKATKEISGMIGAIQDETGKAVDAMFDGSKKVDKGVVLANEAGAALGQIVVGVQNVTDMISHMATSTEEQSATTDEISRNMESIADVAKTNVSAIGEVARATGEMARLAGELKELVGNFKLYEEDFDAHSRTRTGKRQFYVVKDGKQSEERKSYAADNA